MGRGAQDGDHHGHEQACRYALAADIANGNGEMVRIQHEEVVEVATHFAGGAHFGVEFKNTFDCGEVRGFRKERLLDDGGTCQFIMLAALVEDLAGKTMEGGGKLRQLRRRVFQLLQNSRIEFPLFKGRERVGVEADGAVHGVELPTQLANYKKKQIRGFPANFMKLGPADTIHRCGRYGLDGCRAGQVGKDANFPDKLRGMNRRQRHGAKERFGVNTHGSVAEKERSVAGFALLNQYFARGEMVWGSDLRATSKASAWR